MSEELNHGHSGHETSFEREDLSTRGVFAFMIGLAVTGVVTYFIIVGMYTFLDKYERSQMSTASPLVTTKGAISRVVTQEDMDKAFEDNGAPMLETDERGQFRGYLLNQENELNSYGWVDQQGGIARIPITQAMDLLVTRGLPVRSSSGTEAAKPQASKPADAEKATAKKAAQKK